MKNDINKIIEINSSIRNYKTEILKMCKNGKVAVCDESMSGNMEFYTISYEFEKSDTTIAIVYKCREYNCRKYYGNCNVVKQYDIGNLKHEVCLFNNDTLYHYTTVLCDKAPRFFIDYQFKTGKYYYMFTCNSSSLSEGQYIYFMLHIDSLINVKGNTLPELPSIDTISLQEFRESGKMLKISVANPFL
nr:hypothetical protein [uncultured Marinifilum sp.]